MWDHVTRGHADGLWEAAADGKVSDDAFELHSKAATWSSTTQSFELDLLEVTRQSISKPSNVALGAKVLPNTGVPVYFYPFMEPRDGNAHPLRLLSLNCQQTNEKHCNSCLT